MLEASNKKGSQGQSRAVGQHPRKDKFGNGSCPPGLAFRSHWEGMLVVPWMMEVLAGYPGMSSLTDRAASPDPLEFRGAQAGGWAQRASGPHCVYEVWSVLHLQREGRATVIWHQAPPELLDMQQEQHKAQSSTPNREAPSSCLPRQRPLLTRKEDCLKTPSHSGKTVQNRESRAEQW